jgi:hypothetical protein
VKHEESALQAAILKWFSAQYPYLEGLLVGYPGGINLDLKTRVRMKAMGLTAGFPDLQLLVPGSFITEEDIVYGLFIELKTKKGVVSDCQKDYHEKLRLQNYTVIISRSFEEATEYIKWYLMRVPNLNNYERILHSFSWE